MRQLRPQPFCPLFRLLRLLPLLPLLHLLWLRCLIYLIWSECEVTYGGSVVCAWYVDGPGSQGIGVGGSLQYRKYKIK